MLERATELGSLYGVESTTIGQLADDLGLSKSGVIGPFGSKERLNLAAVQAAANRFRAEVWDPVADQPAGKRRLTALMDAWLSYVERDVFPGGCFLTAASFEFDDRPGPVRDAVAQSWRQWLTVIEREVTTAQKEGSLTTERDASQVAFQLHAYVMAGNWAKQLLRDPSALAATRRAIQDVLDRR